MRCFSLLRDFRQVGFLKYWTLSNLPLFFLATPMLCIMMISSFSTLGMTLKLNYQWPRTKKHPIKRYQSSDKFLYNRRAAQCMAIPQLVLSGLALTSYHVQIITRLSSGYPVWHLWLTSIVLEDQKLNLLGRKWCLGRGLCRWIVLYALIQGGLFASFLPPA